MIKLNASKLYTIAVMGENRDVRFGLLCDFFCEKYKIYFLGRERESLLIHCHKIQTLSINGRLF